MMGHRISLKGDEQAKLCCPSCRRHLQLKRGESSYVKRKVRRRERQQGRLVSQYRGTDVE